MRVQHLFALALASLLAAGCALGRAETETKRIAVLKFQGSKAADMQELVADLVAKHHDVVSYKKYRSTARRLGARTMRARNVARVAAALGVDAVVEGKLIRRGRTKYTLRIQVREGATGKTVDEYTIPVRRREMSASNQRTLERKLVDAFDEVEPIARYADEDEADDRDEYARDDGDYDRSERRRARRSSKRSAKRHSRTAARREAQREDRRRDRLRAEREERRRADREERRRADREAERRAERRAARRSRSDRKTRRPARHSDRIDRVDEELEDNPVVLNDEVDADGQFIDDEVPDALK